MARLKQPKVAAVIAINREAVGNLWIAVELFYNLAPAARELRRRGD